MIVIVEKIGVFKQTARKFKNEKFIKLRLQKNSTITDLIDEFKIPKSNIVLITINKKVADVGSVLRDGDTVRLYPPIGGG